jgi:hypothetical protein
MGGEVINATKYDNTCAQSGITEMYAYIGKLTTELERQWCSPRWRIIRVRKRSRRKRSTKQYTCGKVKELR